jgi:cysteinyl-tRNA synthetase
MPQSFSLFDSYLKQIVSFDPNTTTQKNTLKIYSCGPTVYGYQHIGNMRAAWLGDTIVNAAKILGWQTEWVLNITDVGHLVGDGDDGKNASGTEDKMEKAAKASNQKVSDIVDFYTSDYVKQCEALNLVLPKAKMNPKATEYILEQMLLALDLLKENKAYLLDDGIYFDSNRNNETFINNSNISETLMKILEIQNKQSEGQNQDFTGRDIKNTTKSPTDFALWKFVDENSLQKWRFTDYDEALKILNLCIDCDISHEGIYTDIKSKWGCPGWHSECVAMICGIMGDIRQPFSFNNFADQTVIDIHLGGEDHIDIHHKNEILQSEALGFHLSKYWIHNKFVLVDAKKMSKSLGNVYLVKGQKSVTGFDSIEEKGYDALAYRMLLLEHHYTNPMDFTWGKLDQAQARLFNLRKECAKLQSFEISQNTDTVIELETLVVEDFMLEPLINNLDIPLFLDRFTTRLTKLINIVASDKILDLNEYRQLLKLDKEFLKLNLFPNIPVEINQLGIERWNAKKDSNYKLSDELRANALSQGYQIDDYSWGFGIWKCVAK